MIKKPFPHQRETLETLIKNPQVFADGGLLHGVNFGKATPLIRTEGEYIIPVTGRLHRKGPETQRVVYSSTQQLVENQIFSMDFSKLEKLMLGRLTAARRVQELSFMRAIYPRTHRIERTLALIQSDDPRQCKRGERYLEEFGKRFRARTEDLGLDEFYNVKLGEPYVSRK